MLLKLEGDVEVNLEVCDTAGQEDFVDIREPTIAGASCVMFCYSCDSEVSLMNIESKWIGEVKQTTDDKKLPPAILVGTKEDVYDQYDPEHISSSAAVTLGKRINIKEHRRCSAKVYGSKNGNEKLGKVEEVFKTAVRVGIKATHPEYFPDSNPFCFLC